MKNGWKNWKRKAVCILLALCMAANSFVQGVLTVQAAVIQNVWDGVSRSIPETDEDGTFRITNGAELAWFADYVNAGHGEINGRLESNIYLNTSDTTNLWVIIGNTEETPYKGTFDGNGKQIINMRVQISPSQPELRYAGVFGVIDGGSVKNLKVSGNVLNDYKDSTSALTHEKYSASGGIAGYLKNGSIVNCVNNAKTVARNYTFFRNAGGIVGISEGLVIRCQNNGNLAVNEIMGQYRMGGIVGSLYGTDAKVLYCENYGNVDGYFQTGGIAGAMQYGAEILSCCNYGNLSGKWYIGGIVGRIAKAGTNSDGSTKESIVRDVYSLGEITSGDRYGGGIAGEVGYEDGDEQDNPSMPVIENAYSTSQIPTVEYRAAIISHFKSGNMGYAYGLRVDGDGLNPAALRRHAATKLTGPVEMLSEEEMKDGTMLKGLGDGFVACSKYFEYQNNGYPMLAWQIQTNALSVSVNDAVLELIGWLTEDNRVKYGENYTEIESIVHDYVNKLGQVTSEKELKQIMEEAREKLEKVVPGQDADNKLAEAIDNAITKLEEYLAEKISENENLTEEQIAELNKLVDSYAEKINDASSLSEINEILEEGKKAVDEKLDDYAAMARLETARENAITVLKEYRSDQEYAEPWKSEISTARNRGLRLIREADSVSAINKALNTAKSEIDAVIDQIPTEGAWDGETCTEPEQDKNGIYQITNGAEMAWFAKQVNDGKTSICGALCNDISLGGKNWTPIGNSANSPFTGSFEGNGYTVRSLKITESGRVAGLFGYMGGTKTQVIQNLTVAGTIDCDYSAGFAGGITAHAEGNVYFSNCHSRVDITISRNSTRYGAAGGIVGHGENVVVQNCSNDGQVAIVSVTVGGMAYYCGGLIGNAEGNVTLTRSYNNGYVEAEYCAGGLIGHVLTQQQAVPTVTADYNMGEVQGGTYAGGLIGLMELKNGITMNCCYTAGGVNLAHNGKYLGALFGGADGGDISNLYALKRSDQPSRLLVGYSSGFYANGNFVSEKELQSDDMLNQLNASGNNYIKDYLDYQNGYPLLEWEMSVEEFRLGATSELQTFVTADQYTEENWAIVQKLIDEGIANVQAGKTLEEINAALTNAKKAIYEVETKEETAAARLQEAKDAAVAFLEGYLDPSLYREEEQIEITQYLVDGKKWILGAETEAEVTRYLNETKANLDALPTAAQYQYEIDAAAAAEVDAYIENIGEVVFTAYVKSSIQTARVAYDALTEDQKVLVKKYQVLLDAEEAYRLLEEKYEITDDDRELAAVVDGWIAAIGEVTLDSGPAISQARKAYDGLSEKQQALVKNPQTLFEAEKTYDQLRAREVSAAIAAIGEVTAEKLPLIQKAQSLYDALTDAQKALVTDYDVLVKARLNYENLVAAASVIELIDRIGNVTLDSGPAITAAINAYNSLTGDQQDLVTNYETLEKAAAAYDALAAVNRVETLIDQIGVVSAASGNIIQAAREAYNALSDDLKSQVYNLDVLLNAEEAYRAFRNGTEVTVPNTFNGTTMSDLHQNGSGGEDDQSADGSGTDGKDGEDKSKQDNKADVSGGLLDSLVFDYDQETESSLTAQEEAEGIRKKKKGITILVIIIFAVGMLDLLFGFFMKKSSKKRKDDLRKY